MFGFSISLCAFCFKNHMVYFKTKVCFKSCLISQSDLQTPSYQLIYIAKCVLKFNNWGRRNMLCKRSGEKAMCLNLKTALRFIYIFKMAWVWCSRRKFLTKISCTTFVWCIICVLADTHKGEVGSVLFLYTTSVL